ncbi:PIN domain-containing protein [Lysinibacillus sp. ZYM-1]|uniref:PIN domain-containing protein n=1 Tax=Lysinibacillus sp. ZYM-1 TaxID=1681184 RepID=UPI0006CE6A2E|nr:PIN domain-containing protein [Lysinibacillus sp. ZYM-1]KPN89522.1 hypothetical protein AO843_08825 [Lysinibacillus sp. ZYM-1]
MKLKNVFLDTSIYIKNNFEFGGSKFNKLNDLISAGRIQLYSTTIIDNEVISNIDKTIEETRQFVNSVIKEAYVLKNTSPFKSIFAERKPVNIALNEVKNQYDEFKQSTNIENIPINNVDVDDIFKRYFEELPPFSSKKKEEIPDAFTLSALKQWFQKKEDACYILSTDSDMKNYCEENKELIYLDSLDSLFNLIASEDARYEFVIQVFNEHEDEILENIKDDLFDSFILDDIDGEVNEVDVSDLSFVNKPLITEIGDNYAKLSLVLQFDYTAYCSVLDVESSPYDSETKGFLWKDYKDEIYHGSEEIPVEIFIDNIKLGEEAPENADITAKFNNDEMIFISSPYDYY